MRRALRGSRRPLRSACRRRGLLLRSRTTHSPELRRYLGSRGSAWRSPDVALFPFDGREVTIAAVTSDGDDAAAALFFVQFFGNFDGCEDVGAGRMTNG